MPFRQSVIPSNRVPAMAAVVLLAALAIVLVPRPAAAYVEAPYTLGRIIGDSSNVLVIVVEQVDKQKNLIVFRKVRDIKGTHPGETIKHAIEQRGFHPREWQNVMAWAEVGKTAVLFHNGGAGEVCIDNYWYQIYAGDWWGMSHAEPFFLRSYAGKPEKLAAAVAAMLAGQEVVVPCMADGDKNALHLRNGRLLRMKASLKIAEYNFQRDFVDWGAGADEFRPLAGMPGFSHFIALNRMGPGAGAVLPADFNGDGKLDLCLSGAGRLVVLQGAGASFDEVRLPAEVGARAIGWADFDGDGKLDLLAASPTGVRLFRYNGKQFEDLSGGLPEEGYCHPTAAAWIDYDGDRRPDILVADGFRGLRLYRNRGAALPAAPPAQPKLGKWELVGPFDNVDKRGMASAYPPEREIDLGKQYPGKLNEKVAWREGNFADGQQHNLRLFKPECSTNFVVYLHREIEAEGAVELPVSLGCDDAMTVWLNGQRLYQDRFYHPFAQDQVALKLKLRPGKNRLLLKICQGDGDCSFSFAIKPPLPPGMPPPQTPPTFPVTPLLFDDVSDAAGLGTGGAAGGLPGDHLAVVDVNGDGRPDVLLSAGSGILLLNTPQKFVEVKDSGIAYRPGGVAPVFGDFNGDGRPDLFVPQQGVSKLFRNEGGGRFTDATGQAGDLARAMGDARSAVWIDFRGKGRPDLVVGCFKGPNRYFRNEGNGTFTEATDAIGLAHRTYNTSGLAACDINKDKTPDLVFNNEGQESIALLASPAWFAPPPPPRVAQAQPKEPSEAKPEPAASPAVAAKGPAQGAAAQGAATAGVEPPTASPEEEDPPPPVFSSSVVSGPPDPGSARGGATEDDSERGPGWRLLMVLGFGMVVVAAAAGVVRYLSK